MRIAISGKAGTGKDTLCKLLIDRIKAKYWHVEQVSLADPIKKMAKIMIPFITDDMLYGDSELRNTIIPNHFKEGIPLTVRQVLIDLGTGLGRSYNEDIWLNNMNERINQFEKVNRRVICITTDVRFRNEFDFVKANKFITVRIIRNSDSKSNHSSEIEQDKISNDEFDYVVDNNKPIDNLNVFAVKLIENLR